MPNAIQNNGLSTVCLRVVLSVFDIWTMRRPNTLKSYLTRHYNLNRLLMNSHSLCKQDTSDNDNIKVSLTPFLNWLFIVPTGVSTHRIWDPNAQLWSHSGHTPVTPQSHSLWQNALNQYDQRKPPRGGDLRQTTVLAMKIYKMNGSGGGTWTPDTRIMIPLL